MQTQIDSYPCPYIKGNLAIRQSIEIGTLSLEEQANLLNVGYRRAGTSYFRMACPNCSKCIPVRIPTETFVRSKSQERVWKRGSNEFKLRIESPTFSKEKLLVHLKFHEHGHRKKDWSSTGTSIESYLYMHMVNPLPSEDWVYSKDGHAVAVGFVDRLPGIISARYFIHDPELARFSLGVLNVLTMCAIARLQGVPYVHLGFWVEGNRSLDYKRNFGPHELLIDDEWVHDSAVSRSPIVRG